MSSDTQQYIAQLLAKADKPYQPTVVAELCKLLLERKTDEYVRRDIAETLGALVDDEKTVRRLAPLVLDRDIENAMYEALWAMSRRVEVRIFWDGKEGEGVKVVKM